MPDLFLNKKKLDDFIQVMNSGKLQLLKYTKRRIMAADSLFGTLNDTTVKMNYIISLNPVIRVVPVKKLD